MRWTRRFGDASAPTPVIRGVGCPNALAVGLANSEVEFAFPTSKEVGHPSIDRGMTKSCGWQSEAGGVPWVLLPDTHFPVKEDTPCESVRHIRLPVQRRRSAMG